MDFLWWALAMVVAALGGWPVTAGVLRLARESDARKARTDAVPRNEKTDPAADSTVDDLPEAADTSGMTADDGTRAADGTEILRGGLLIGVLERLAVALAVLGDQPVAIAYIVAIKGLGRYAELKKTPAASERFIIGTLSSMFWAAAVATAAKWLWLQ
ncbi:MAG: hypothetical protein HIU81_08675 [Acidobacteria bacterium]|nr:hypothetical protein [Acidobacteriota bacterium]